MYVAFTEILWDARIQALDLLDVLKAVTRWDVTVRCRRMPKITPIATPGPSDKPEIGDK